MFQLQSPLTTFQRLPAGPPPRAGFLPVPGTILKPGSGGLQQGPRPPYAMSAGPAPVPAIRSSFDSGLSSVASPAPLTFSRSAVPGSIQTLPPPPPQHLQQVVGPPPLAGFTKK